MVNGAVIDKWHRVSIQALLSSTPIAPDLAIWHSVPKPAADTDDTSDDVSLTPPLTPPEDRRCARSPSGARTAGSPGCGQKNRKNNQERNTMSQQKICETCGRPVPDENTDAALERILADYAADRTARAERKRLAEAPPS